MRIAGFLGFLAIAQMPVAAMAQYGAFDMGMLTNTLAQDHVTKSEQARASARSRGVSLSPRSLSPLLSRPSGLTDRPRASAAQLTYSPSASVRRANFARFVERTRAKDPRTAANLQRLFETQDVMAMADGWMAPYGLTCTNVADAMAVYLTTAWLASRGSDADAEKSKMLAVRDQIASAIGATPQFATASDGQKQEVAEAMIVQAILASQYATAAQKDPKLMSAVKEAVATGAERTFGFDIRSLELTSQGLR